MKKTVRGFLFNRIEKMGDKEYNHIGCEGEDEEFGHFLASFVPKIGMKRKVRITIETLEPEEEGLHEEEKLDQKELASVIDTSETKPEWNPDPKGYFTIKPFFSQNKVFVRYYDSSGNLKYTFAGVTTTQIIQEIVKRGLISRLDHAAYLGKEIEKALIALRNNLHYTQDEELRVE